MPYRRERNPCPCGDPLCVLINTLEAALGGNQIELGMQIRDALLIEHIEMVRRGQ